MKNLFVLLFVGLVGVSCFGVVAAQELLTAPSESDVGVMVPDLAMPPMPDAVEEVDQPVDDTTGKFNTDQQYDTTPYSEEWGSSESVEQLEPFVSDDCEMFHYNQPVLESTGTWIRRGFWYAEVDAVIFNRKFGRDSLVLASQPVGISSSPFRQTTVDNQLVINGTRPGMEAAPRFTLGHFFFRDYKNRDHVAEFTAYGGGEWTQYGELTANPNNNLGTTSLVVPVVTDGGNTSFDNATQSDFRYDSRFNSFELNYLVKDRMGRDHMEMEPSGRWVRRARPTASRTFLAGVRFFDLNENFDWSASGIDPDDDDSTDDTVDDDFGNASILVDNDLFGTQVGFSWMYETARWSGGARAKGGMFLNLIDTKNVFFRTQNLTGDDIYSESSLEADELSFIGEAALIGKWHLRPNFSLRAGLEVLFISSVASAPKQLPGVFVPGGPPQVASHGDSTWLGGSIGFEGYW